MSLVSLSLKYDVLIRISGDGCSQVHFCNVYDFRQESRMNKMLSTYCVFLQRHLEHEKQILRKNCYSIKSKQQITCIRSKIKTNKSYLL